MRHGFILYARKQTVVGAVEARGFDKPSELQGAAICRQGYDLCFLGHKKVVLGHLCLVDIL